VDVNLALHIICHIIQRISRVILVSDSWFKYLLTLRVKDCRSSQVPIGKTNLTRCRCSFSEVPTGVYVIE
jgi:hypothetical protein